MISHDRWFLDRIATHILAFEGDSKVVWCEGNFRVYEEQTPRTPRRRRRSADADQVPETDNVNTAARDTRPRGDRPEDVLDIAEILYESGSIRFRFSRYIAADGARWVRHGLFVAYHESGVVASEGQYVDGLEQGLWRDFHENSQLAAEGLYLNGKEHGYWRFWTSVGAEETPVEYEDGEAVSP